MATAELVNTLYSNRLLRTEAEVETFDAALDALARASDAGEYLDDLHRVFDARTGMPDVMFGLLHFIEGFDVDQGVRSLLRVLPEMSTSAGEWLEHLLFGIVGEDEARKTLRNLLSSSATPNSDIAIRYLRDLAAKESGPARDALLSAIPIPERQNGTAACKTLQGRIDRKERDRSTIGERYPRNVLEKR